MFAEARPRRLRRRAAAVLLPLLIWPVLALAKHDQPAAPTVPLLLKAEAACDGRLRLETFAPTTPGAAPRQRLVNTSDEALAWRVEGAPRLASLRGRDSAWLPGDGLKAPAHVICR